MATQATSNLSELSLKSEVTASPKKQVLLYGGAIAAEVPAELLDASDLRQVPDYQECFVHPELKDRSLVVELLDINDDEATGATPQPTTGEDRTLEESIRRHFAGLDESEGPATTISFETASVQRMALKTPITPPKGHLQIKDAVILQGTHRLQKFNEGTRKRVRVAMGMIRLESVGTELLVVMYDADESAGESDEGESETNAGTDGALLPLSGAEQTQATTTLAAVVDIIQSIQFLEWTLFPEYAPEGYTKWA